MKKPLTIFLITLFLSSSLSASLFGSTPPIYSSGMSYEEYGAEFGEWLGKKLDNSNEREIEEYIEKANTLRKDYKQKVSTINDKQEILKLTDSLIKNILYLAEHYFELSEEDWAFIIDPQVDNSASKQSKEEIYTGILYIMHQMSNNKFTTPQALAYATIEDSLQGKNDGYIYYYILTQSKYKHLLATNEEFNRIKDRVVLTQMAVDIAKENVDFDISFKDIVSNIKKFRSLKYDLSNFSIIKLDNSVKNIFKLANNVKDFNYYKQNSAFYPNENRVFDELTDIEKNIEFTQNRINYTKQRLNTNPKDSILLKSLETDQIQLTDLQNKAKNVTERLHKRYKTEKEILDRKLKELSQLIDIQYNYINKIEKAIKAIKITKEKIIANGYDNTMVEKITNIPIGYMPDINTIKSYLLTENNSPISDMNNIFYYKPYLDKMKKLINKLN